MREGTIIHSMKALLYGLIVCGVILLLLTLLCAGVVYWSPLSEEILPKLAVVVDILALLAGGYTAGRINGGKGLLMGLITAGVVLLLMLPLGGAESNIIQKALYCLLAGMAGGVFGVR